MTNKIHLLVAGYLLSTAAAQDTSEYPDFNVNDVEPTTRMKWCSDQEDTCETLCGSSVPTIEKSCDHNSLLYACTCADGSTPEFDDYTQTITWYECEYQLQQCKDDGGQDCQATIGSTCPTLDPATGKSSNANDANAEPSTTDKTESSATSSTNTASHTGKSTPSASKAPSGGSDDGSISLDTSALIAIVVVGLLVVLGLVALLFFKLGNRRNRAGKASDASGGHRDEMGGDFEKLNDDPSTTSIPQIYEMTAAQEPVELDSTPWSSSAMKSSANQKVLPSEFPKVPPTSFKRSSTASQPVELDSRMMPLDIKIEPRDSKTTSSSSNNMDNTKYRF